MLEENDIYTLLDERGIAHTVRHHPAVFTVDEALSVDIPADGVFVKTLFLRDDKKRNHYLVTAPFERRIDLKALSDIIPSRRLGFASENDLLETLGLTRGSVTPFGILNDTSSAVQMVFDEALRDVVIGIHPLINTATVFLATADVAALIEEHGNPVIYREM